jgi:hypothetical protein
MPPITAALKLRKKTFWIIMASLILEGSALKDG